jgi:hypothetical protein
MIGPGLMPRLFSFFKTWEERQMSFKEMLLQGLLHTISSLHPDYKPLVDFALSHEVELNRLAPVLKAAAKEGPGAFAAAQKQAPELAKAIHDLVSSMPIVANSPAESKAVIAVHSENVTRQLVGLPHFTPDEEKVWMDNASAASGLG